MKQGTVTIELDGNVDVIQIEVEDITSIQTVTDMIVTSLEDGGIVPHRLPPND